MHSQFFKLLIILTLAFGPFSHANVLCQKALSRFPIFQLIDPGPKREATKIILDEALDEFFSSYNLETLDLLLQSIEQQGMSAVDSKIFKTLKDSRKKASVLRLAFQLVSRDHKAPKDFDRFVRSFGHLNDLIVAGRTQDLQNQASKVRVRLTEVRQSKSLEENKKLSSGKNLLKYLKDQRDDVKKARKSSRLFHFRGKQKQSLLNYTFSNTVAIP